MSINEQTNQKAKPSMKAYHVKDVEGKKGIWTEIGAVWPHKDNKGFDIVLDLMPVSTADGKVKFTIREPLPKEEKSTQKEKASVAA